MLSKTVLNLGFEFFTSPQSRTNCRLKKSCILEGGPQGQLSLIEVDGAIFKRRCAAGRRPASMGGKGRTGSVCLLPNCKLVVLHAPARVSKGHGPQIVGSSW